MEEVSVSFRTPDQVVQALAGVSLQVEEGEFVALLGPTGCGKSTLLRVVSDLTHPSAGLVEVRGRPAADARRANEFGFVFQEPALLPWRSALGNVEALLEVVGLTKFVNRYPHELSGGMKQRVAIVRALAWNPSILLMDEPFSALDELTKSELQDELLQIWSKERKTILFVTHNISEAVYLADRVVVMSAHPGRIVATLPVELPRSRDPGVRETLEFVQHVKRAREALKS